MKFGQAKGPRFFADHPDRRLLGGLLVSLLLHGVVLLLQFGVPSLGLPGTAPPLSIRIASVDSPVAPALPVPVAPPAPVPLPEPVSPSPQPLPPPRPVSGMRLLDPAIAPPPPAPPVKPVPVVRKDKPRRARRISTPMPAAETLVEPSRVIAQDSTLNDFNVAVPRPEEAQEKTIDIKEAQHGEDDGDAATSAALAEEQARAGRIKAEADAAAEAAAQQLAQEARQAESRAAARQAADQLRADEQLARQQIAQQQSELLKREQLQQEQLKQEQRKAEQLAADRQKVEQLKLEQQRAEQAKFAQQQAEQQRAEQQRLQQQKAEQQRAEQQKAEQQRAEQQRAEQQRAEQQRAEQQRAEQQRAEQQRAERERGEREAAQQRGRELAAAQPGIAGQGGPAAGSGAGGGTVTIPKNMLGSDLGNRARELVRGLDVLRGSPPVPRRAGDRRAVVSFNERDLPLKMYVESWRQKIERNGALNYPRSWVDAVRMDPLVSVAVRSDGSVEDVIIVTSSGRADMDEAVRRIVRVNARYSPFPAQIAEKYDVIEIRRVWRFDEALKLMEELH